MIDPLSTDPLGIDGRALTVESHECASDTLTFHLDHRDTKSIDDDDIV
jgi:hypothetical protein